MKRYISIRSKRVLNKLAAALLYIAGKALAVLVAIVIVFAFIAASLLTSPFLICGYIYQLIKQL